MTVESLLEKYLSPLTTTNYSLLLAARAVYIGVDVDDVRILPVQNPAARHLRLPGTARRESCGKVRLHVGWNQLTCHLLGGYQLPLLLLLVQLLHHLLLRRLLLSCLLLSVQLCYKLQ